MSDVRDVSCSRCAVAATTSRMSCSFASPLLSFSSDTMNLPSDVPRRSSSVQLAILVLCSWVVYHVALDAHHHDVSPSSPSVPSSSTNVAPSAITSQGVEVKRRKFDMVAEQWFPSMEISEEASETDEATMKRGSTVMTGKQTMTMSSSVAVPSSSEAPQGSRIIEQTQKSAIDLNGMSVDSSIPNNATTAVDNNNLASVRERLRYQQLPPLDPSLVNVVHNHEMYSLLLNIEEDLPFRQGPHVPYFWHIHKSGGSSMKHIMTCLERTQTRRMTVPDCNDQEPDLKVCKLEWGSVVNADASSPDGIERIIRLKLVGRNFDKFVLDTSRVYEALGILTPQHRGRLFMVLRDPVERAISKFYYTKVATWERNYRPEVQNMTMLEYASSHHCYNNWITRRLVNKMVGELEDRDLAIAKEILRQKALILLTSKMSEAGERLIKYFGWKATPYQHSCIRKFAVEEPINTNPHPVPSRDSAEWNAIRERNLYDVELYEYAQQLYRHQAAMLEELVSGP